MADFAREIFGTCYGICIFCHKNEELTTKPTSEPIVEAQGLVVNSRGEVELVAQVSASNFHNYSQQAAYSCGATS